MAFTMLRTLQLWFRPLLTALFCPHIPWRLRWRVLLLQPISLLTYSIASFPYLFNRPFTVEHLPIFPQRLVRALVFKAPGSGKGRKLRPLHIEIHGGGFLGGLAEGSARFNDIVARETGAVVVGITYRFAPEHVFPVAIDDVDAAIRWIREHAAERWGADPELMTVGGTSAGGNLALAATQQPECHSPSPHAFKAAVLFYPAIDLRLTPGQKPKPAGMSEADPFSWLYPLFDAYCTEARAENYSNPRLNPILASRETLPERLLLVSGGFDILLAEETAFTERVNEEDAKDGKDPRVELCVEPGQMHGYTEVPDVIVSAEVKNRAFSRGVNMLREVHASHGWSWTG